MATECNVPNRTIFCKNNIDVLRQLNSECIDLIYLDPPFNKNKEFIASLGSHAEGASFKDIFRDTDIKDEWLQTIREDLPELYQYLTGIKGVGKSYNFAYLAYMAIRLIECHRVLKSSGSIYLHCDPTMSHYLKTTMDCIFKEDNFLNEILWCYTGPGNFPRYFPTKHDVLLFYQKGGAGRTFNYDAARVPYKKLRTGKTRGIFKEDYELSAKGKIAEDYWLEDRDEMTPVSRLKRERLGYPTQKPLSLLERIIKVSSNKNDIVLDPFCGCATTCVAAERLGRKWIGVDVSIKAYELVQERLIDARALASEAKHEHQLKSSEIFLRTDPPKRTDLGKSYREIKSVYVISHPKFADHYKVGIAKNVKSRLNSYQTSDPKQRFKLEFSRETPYFRQIEAHVSRKFENKHAWIEGDLKELVVEIDSYQPPYLVDSLW